MYHPIKYPRAGGSAATTCGPCFDSLARGAVSTAGPTCRRFAPFGSFFAPRLFLGVAPIASLIRWEKASALGIYSSK